MIIAKRQYQDHYRCVVVVVVIINIMLHCHFCKALQKNANYCNGALDGISDMRCFELDDLCKIHHHHHHHHQYND